MINIPTPPRDDETKDEFIKRCIPVYINEGYPKDQATAICYDMWKKKHPESKSNKCKEEIMNTIYNLVEYPQLAKSIEEAIRGFKITFPEKEKNHIHMDIYGNIRIVDKSDNRKIIAGYASLAVIDTENEYIPVEVLKEGLNTLMTDESYSNIMIVHKNIQIGKILKEFGDLTTHVDDDGLFVVAEIRDDLEIAKATWMKIESGEIQGFSIGGEIIEEHEECDEKSCIKVIDKINLFEISVCSCPVNKDSGFKIINKCDVSIMLENLNDKMTKKIKKEPEVKEKCEDCEPKELQEDIVEEKVEEKSEPELVENKVEILTKSDIIETIRETITETLKSLKEKELQEEEDEEDEEDDEEEPEDEEEEEEEMKKSDDTIVQETDKEIEMALKARDDIIDGFKEEIKELREQIKKLEEVEEKPKTKTVNIEHFEKDSGIIVDKRHGRVYRK